MFKRLYNLLWVRALLALALQFGIIVALVASSNAADLKIPDLDVTAATWITIGYTLSVLAGVTIHFYNDKWKGKTGSDSLWQYLTADAPGSSMAMVIVLLTSVGGVIASGILVPMSGWAIFLLGLQNGYTTDSLVNAGAPVKSAAPAPAQ